MTHIEATRDRVRYEQTRALPGIRFPRKGSKWTLVQCEQLVDLWQKGHSASVIGSEIGFSRCAVLGQAHRMNLPLRTTAGVLRAEKQKRPTKVTTTPVKRAYAGMPKLRKTLLTLKAEPAAAPATTPVNLMERTGCAFPVARTHEHLFCNAPKHGEAGYCSFHLAKMYQPPKVRAA